jgi:hypothetical protein
MTMTRNTADFRGVPEHKSITMMTPAEILATAQHEGTPQEIDNENAESGLEKKYAKGLDPKTIPKFEGHPMPITIGYYRNKNVIIDGNHRVRALSKVLPNTTVPVMHWRMNEDY